MLAYAAIWVWSGISLAQAAEASLFTMIGVFGASIANSTGTGGGVVFVPAFSIVESRMNLSLDTGQIVAMSLLIQCFGMSVGALTWVNRLFGAADHLAQDHQQSVFLRVILLSAAGCLPALWLTQSLLTLNPAEVLVLFKSFSIVLGLVLLASLLRKAPAAHRQHLTKADQIVLMALGVLGGVATALFSVGVGEFVALYLFIRGFHLNTAVGTAVVVTALTVIASAPLAIANQEIVWPIVAMAVPGVALGGFLGRRIAQSLGAQRLKLIAGLWIVGSSMFLIVAKGS